ncbi:MAG: hypothetical protein LW698_15465, partial [Planctomycetaceae bacterium]|nr:hypothetical protein [Planctomycetaceae bacterium]
MPDDGTFDVATGLRLARGLLIEIAGLGLPARVVVDCSHANSGKDHRRQSVVWRDVLEQRIAGDR